MRAIGSHLFLSPEQVVQRALFLALVDKTAMISVAGPDGLEAILSLCRAGYERVECARQATCAGAEEACDLLLVVGPMTAEELADTLRRTARLLRDGGCLVVQSLKAEDEAVVAPALRALGMEILSSVIDRSAGRLVMHRIQRRALLRKAG
jgi:hypothetical protein